MARVRLYVSPNTCLDVASAVPSVCQSVQAGPPCLLAYVNRQSASCQALAWYGNIMDKQTGKASAIPMMLPFRIETGRQQQQQLSPIGGNMII